MNPQVRYRLLKATEGTITSKSAVQDSVALKEAAEKLKAAKGFERGDTLVMNALGDALVALAECAPDSNAQQGLLQSALSEGYAAALRVDRRNSDALVGTAEVEMQLGRGASHSSCPLVHCSQG